ncbi:MAG: hypothetical protein V3R94_07645 [Acidobacteriota bacterium]
MLSKEEKLEQLDQITGQIMTDWYERVRHNYVTEDDGRDLGVEPELKRFHESMIHRLKFSRQKDLDVTYGLGVSRDENQLIVETSVNNKSEGFDYEAFVNGLKDHYWRARDEKPWTDPDFDHFTYEDLLLFEPVMGQSVTLDKRKDKADIIRLNFQISPQHEDLLLGSQNILRDLIEDYCLVPVKRIYAQSYQGE